MSETDATPDVPNIAELGPRFLDFLERLERPIVFLDIESTGIDPQRDRIIEICLVRITPTPVAIEAPRVWRINPGMKIPRESEAVHGIANADLRDAPSFKDVAAEIVAMLEGADLGGFSLQRLDVRLLQQELKRAKVELDLNTARLVDAQVIFHKREPRDLTAAMRFYCGDVHDDAHGARADALASLRVFAGQLERYDDLSLDVGALNELAASLNAGFVDSGRRFMWRDDEPAFNFGKLRGKSLRWAASEPAERPYLRWILEGPFEEDAKQVVREALEGRIRTRKAP